jgi:hypothetical protein
MAIMAADMIIKKKHLSLIQACPITAQGATWLDENYGDWDLDDGVVILPELLDEEIERMQECGRTVVKKF